MDRDAVYAFYARSYASALVGKEPGTPTDPALCTALAIAYSDAKRSRDVLSKADLLQQVTELLK